MPCPDDAVAHITAKLALAPYDSGQWLEALGALAEATGSRHAQMVGWMGSGNVPMNLISDEPSGLFQEWIELGGTDPAHNSIIRAGVQTPVLQTVSDVEVVSLGERKFYPIWGEFYDRHDIPHICFTSLWRNDSAQLVLTVIRSSNQGPIGPEQRKIFSAIAPRWREAALLTRALKQDGTRVLTGAIDALSVPTIVLDGFGCVMTFSAAGEQVLRDGTLLRLDRAHRVVAASGGGRELEQVIAGCLPRSGKMSASVSVAISGSNGAAAMLRVGPLPRQACDLGFGPAAIIVIESAPATPARVLRPNLASVLTPAEAEITTALLSGERAWQIAERRGVSVETVRSQIKSIYNKLEVSSHVELLAKATTPHH